MFGSMWGGKDGVKPADIPPPAGPGGSPPAPDMRPPGMVDFDAEMKADRLKREQDVAKRVVQAQLGKVEVDGARRLQGMRGEQQHELEHALGVDSAGMSRVKGAERLIAAVNAGFLLVVVGCELDLYGFGMAYQEYWSTGLPFVQMLLIVCPLGYLLAVSMYYYYRQSEQDRIQRSTPPADSSYTNPYLGPGAPRPAPTQAPVPKRPTVHMRYFHFLPLFRYYVVVKEKEADDIEAIFRVNSLSSFSLGVAQIAGLVFTAGVLQEELTIFHWINIISQAINWIITILYFTTPMSQRMKTTIELDAIKYNDSEWLKAQQRLHKELTKKSADEENQHAKTELQGLDKTLDNLIQALAVKAGKVDLSGMDIEWKFEVLRKLFQKRAAEYSKA